VAAERLHWHAASGCVLLPQVQAPLLLLLLALLLLLLLPLGLRHPVAQ
jgi:hypothetical protein